MQATHDLPTHVDRILEDFMAAARQACGGALRSVVLYGSGAEGRLRATSDVNLILVLTEFTPLMADGLREPLRVGQAAARLAAMFLLESEVSAAVHAYPVKYLDIMRRHRILHGSNPFEGLSISRDASVFRLKQVLLNLRLRLRSLYILRGLNEEQLALVVADAAGPLRSCAATLLELEGHPASSPKEALEQMIPPLEDPAWHEAVSHLSEAREKQRLQAGVAGKTLFRLMELTELLLSRLSNLPKEDYRK
ncbi:MAG TPA: nucleotidyltransferase domain-containing protein [Terriglobia bacterium]|nr:nucleotidyltransferase domain-containing protein [Terriglobia bacterium]